MSKSNPRKLGEAPIGKLLLEYSIPSIVGMTLTSLYNIIDSIFIGHGVGAMALSGLAITFPLMNLLVAFCALVGVGGATIASIRLGAGDHKGAEMITGNVAILCFLSALFYGGLTSFFLDDILTFFGASEATLPYAREFMQIILLGCPIFYFLMGLNNVMRATGYPRKAMWSSMLTVGCNVVLAPIFIFAFEWGIRGAAFATVLSQFVGMVWVFSHFLNKKNFVHFTRESFKLRWRIMKNIFSVGISPFLMNVCACVVVIFINTQLANYGDDLSIGAFGIVNRVQMLFIMIVLGLAQGMQPIAGYNWGAGKIDRVKHTVKLCLGAATVVTSLGAVIGWFFPDFVVHSFSDDAELAVRTVPALQIAVSMFPIVGLQVVICQFYQSIGKAGIAIFLSLSRQLVFFVPLLAILPLFWGVTGVWLSIPASDFFAVALAVIMFRIYVRKLDASK